MKKTRWTFRDWEKWKDPAKETKKEKSEAYHIMNAKKSKCFEVKKVLDHMQHC